MVRGGKDVDSVVGTRRHTVEMCLNIFINSDWHGRSHEMGSFDSLVSSACSMFLYWARIAKRITDNLVGAGEQEGGVRRGR